jgi:hypothetical protein
MNNDVFELLNLRFEFEEVTRKYKLPFKDATLDNLKWYKKNGHKSNRFRPMYDQSMKLCEAILEMSRPVKKRRSR